MNTVITTKTYPTISFSRIIPSVGVYNKEIRLPQSFLTTSSRKIFTNKFTPSQLSTKKISMQKVNGYTLELLFHGLNYHLKRTKLYRNKFYLDVHKSELHICHEATANTFKSRVFKRRLVFFSFDKKIIDRLRVVIKAFKVPDRYTGKGILTPDDTYDLKEGKKR